MSQYAFLIHFASFYSPYLKLQRNHLSSILDGPYRDQGDKKNRRPKQQGDEKHKTFSPIILVKKIEKYGIDARFNSFNQLMNIYSSKQ